MLVRSTGFPRSVTGPGPALALAVMLTVLALGGCGGRSGKTKVKLPPPINPRTGWTQVGVASWYGHPYHGRITSNGETYDMNEMTAAHKRLPFQSILRVRNLSNGRTTVVRINDRGPFFARRIIDLSRAAASEIGMIGPGTARVRLTLIKRAGSNRRRNSRTARANPSQSDRRQGRFDIQIGVFSARLGAETLADKVRNRGHRASIQRFSEAGSLRFRVLVSGGSYSQADSRLRTLKEQGFDGFLAGRR